MVTKLLNGELYIQARDGAFVAASSILRFAIGEVTAGGALKYNVTVNLQGGTFAILTDNLPRKSDVEDLIDSLWDND